MTLFENPLYQEDIKIIDSLKIDLSKLSKAKILITGGTGLIGTILVDMICYLNQANSLELEIDLISRNADKCRLKFNHIKTTKINIIEHDINQPLNISKKYDFIIHGASNTHPLLYSTDPIGSLTTNLFGTYNLLELAAQNNNSRFVLLSTVEIYGEDKESLPDGFSETDFGYLDCNTVRANYCEGKRASESLCQAYKAQKGVDVVIPRLCRCYGPTLKKDDSKALSQFLNNSLEEKDIILKSKGDQYYSYIYSADAATAIIYVMLKGESGEAYNISDKNSDITLKNLAELISHKNNKKVIIQLPDQVEKNGYSKATRAILNSAKLNKLGWKPKYSIEEGINRTLDILKLFK